MDRSRGDTKTRQPWSGCALGRWAWSALVVLVLGPAWSSPVSAKPEAPSIVCGQYPDLPDCVGRVADCGMCHVATFPPSWNPFGTALQAELARQESFEVELLAALMTLEVEDSDGDGVGNLDELHAGTGPGDATSFPMGMAEPPEEDPNASPTNPDYRVGQYDPAFAFKRVMALYCGRSPSYEDMAPFRDAGATEDALRERVHDQLSSCLDSEYWRKEGLMRLADDRIRPIKNLSSDTDVTLVIPVDSLTGDIRLKSVMGDYHYDYRLWSYVLTANRDARDLLLAQYYIVENPDGSWSKTEETIPKTDKLATAGGQQLQKPYRAGMITTMWFLTRNTMFSALPRTTAAAAYRSYLGMDVSLMEGLMPVAGEPDDIDNKGVDRPRCAACHSTLDPLSYAFAKYNGFDFDLSHVLGLLLFGDLPNTFGIYNELRPTTRMPGWSDIEQQPFVLGEPVNGLVAWAQRAANSDAFARNLANIFFVHAFSHEPNAEENAVFTELWESLPGDGYSANRLLHRLVDMPTFGVP